jgi:cysteinyl-tRNA synthetase
MPLKLYNTLTKSLEPFVPQDPDHIRFYTCGPTVYDDAHIGNFRSFLAADLLRRWLESPLCTLTDAEGNEHAGPRTVTHVMNITDVGHMTDDNNADGGGEDKMDVAARRILEAKKSGTLPPDAKVDPNNPFQIAQFYEARFKSDAKALGMKVAIDADKDPSLMPRATGNIKEMKQVIEDLLEKGDAYPAGSPGARAIYFNIQNFKRYGNLSGNTLDQLKGGAGGRVDESNQSEKKHPADFLLWKEDASHKMKWPSPKVPGPNGQQDEWGDGYPGWHIECTAMALGRLIPGGLNAAKAKHAHIDLHSGGEDNIFPHHECEIAQSCCFTGADHFATHWFHPRFLKVDGQKMSKSKGTMYTLGDLTAKGFDPAAVRLELIKTHYRANADFSIQGLKDSTRSIERIRRDAKLLTSIISEGRDCQTNISDVVREFAEALENDLNIAKAIASLNSLTIDTAETSGSLDVVMRSFGAKKGSGKDIPDVILPTEPEIAEAAANTFQTGSVKHAEKALAALHLIDNILGVIFRPVEKAQDTGIALYQPGVTPSDEIESLLQQRADAKKSKDFAAADAIRDQLTALGLSIMDKPGGKVEVAIAN